MPGNPAYAGMVVTVSFPPEIIVLSGEPLKQWAGSDAVTENTLSNDGLTVTDPSFISLKTRVNGSRVVFAGAPVSKGPKVGTIPAAAPPKDRITIV